MSDVDPTRVTNQDAVRRPKPRVWIVASGLLALVAVVLFAFPVAIFAAIAVNGCTGRRGAYQGYIFAVLLCVQAAVALAVTLVIAAAAWASVG